MKYTGVLTGEDGSILEVTALRVAAPVAPPVVVQPAAAKLSLTPPVLTVPIVKRITNADRSVSLDPTKDYVIEAPEVMRGRTDINGGRNVRWIGGEVAANTGDARAIYLNGQTGTVWVEGVHIRAGEGQILKEGFNVAHKGRGVFIVNTLVDEVHGLQAGHHADVIQCWGMPTRGLLHLERLVGTTSYQWGMWQPRQFASTATATDFLVRIRDCLAIRTSDEGYTWYDAASAYTRYDIQGFQILPKSGSPNPYYPRDKAPAGITVLDPKASPASPLLGKPGLGYVSPGYAA